MTDIVERLKEGEPCQIEGGMPCKEISFKGGCLCAEAADEIERLTNALKRIEACRLLESDTHRAIARKTLKESNRT